MCPGVPLLLYPVGALLFKDRSRNKIMFRSGNPANLFHFSIFRVAQPFRFFAKVLYSIACDKKIVTREQGPSWRAFFVEFPATPVRTGSLNRNPVL